MTKRLNITIPNELAKRLDRLKAKTAPWRLNVSAVCAEALRREVVLRELAARTASG